MTRVRVFKHPKYTTKKTICLFKKRILGLFCFFTGIGVFLKNNSKKIVSILTCFFYVYFTYNMHACANDLILHGFPRFLVKKDPRNIRVFHDLMFMGELVTQLQGGSCLPCLLLSTFFGAKRH